MTPRLVLRIVRAVLAVYGVLYVGCALFKPATFVGGFAVDVRMPYSPDLKEKLVIFGRLALTCLAVGVLVYLAAFSISAMVPENLVTVDDDGEDHSLRMTVHWGLTLFGTLGLIGGCEDSAKERYRASFATRQEYELEMQRRAGR